MLDIAFVLLLTAWSALVGRAILLRLDAIPACFVDTLALAVPLGLGTLALAALGLGEIGHLHRAGFVAVFSLGVFAAVLRMRGHDPERHAQIQVRAPMKAHPVDRLFDLAFALTILGTLLTALAPVTDGDALCYHLQVPKIFLLNHAMTFDPDLHETVYPLGTEMLYAVALAFRGPVACRLIQWILGLCFAANVTALARPCLGPRARWAGTIAMLVPAISNGMGAPLNDVALAAFGNASLVAVMLWRDRPTASRAVLAGVLAGMAIGVKYPALVWAGVLGMGMIAPRTRRIRDSRFEILQSLVRFSLAALITGGAWYLRAYMHTGNPVYPFFRQVFGGAGIDDVLDPIKRPMPVTLVNLVTALGPMTLDPDRFDSLSHQFGPVFLLLMPGLFLLKPPRRVVGLGSIGFLFLTLCLTQRQSMRFVLASVGPFAVAAAWVATTWCQRRSMPGRLLVGGVALVLLFEASLAIGRARHGVRVVLGRESEEAFLMRREPTYRVGTWVERNLPGWATIVGQDHRGFYIPRPYTMELAHRRRTGLGTRGEVADEIISRLKRDGFTHLLTCPPEPESSVEFDPLLSRQLGSWLAARTPLYEEAITDPDGVSRRYRIDALDEPARMAEAGGMRR
ncbi:MAG: family glycosyltransferase, 4-amino-4-deoxy-L-arabinose transferase [Planctomycetota bacterium]|nr:family glycosyltransferase, 4-amino-4-deoxy-L-arabinose transferase [Planctomycetota bacterium]